jgi:hypothetical protein
VSHNGDAGKMKGANIPDAFHHFKQNYINIVIICYYLYTKGKAIPVLTWTGHEGFRKLRLPYFITIGCQLYASVAFTPQEVFLVLISVGG